MADPTSTGSRFATTSWTLVVDARTSPEALNVLLERYWSPVYAYYRRLGEPPDAATDLTQGFLAKVIAEPRLIEAADSERGRFRTFLKQALRNHRVDEIRREIGRDGTRPRTFVPEDRSVIDRAEPAAGADPAHAFDRQWSAATLDTVLVRLEAECHRAGLVRHLDIFRARVLNPIVSGGEPESIESIVSRLGLRDHDECSKMLYTIKRKCRDLVREVVGETVESDDEIDDEIRLVLDGRG